jgi:hypothetical protein
VRACLWACVHMSVLLSVHVSVYMYMLLCVCVCVCVCVCMCVCVCVCMCVCVCVCVCVKTYFRTSEEVYYLYAENAKNLDYSDHNRKCR